MALSVRDLLVNEIFNGDFHFLCVGPFHDCQSSSRLLSGTPSDTCSGQVTGSKSTCTLAARLHDANNSTPNRTVSAKLVDLNAAVGTRTWNVLQTAFAGDRNCANLASA